MDRDKFMELVYETFADEPDNVLANGIIEAADAYVEHEKAQLFKEDATSDLISRQWLMECVNEGWIKFDTDKDANRFIHLVRDIAPSAQPEPTDIDAKEAVYNLAEKIGIHQLFALTVELRGEPIQPELTDEQVIDYCGKKGYKIVADDLFDLLSKSEPHWIPVSERLPSKEERKEWIDNNLDGIGYLYPCLVTRYSSINPDRTKNNPYVAKHYFDGEDFLNAGEEVCSEYIIAWMPLPEAYNPNK